MRNRGQAAMEFLMTYGWAILVVLAAIGALAYFGVLSPDRLLPDKCTISPPFGPTCSEYKINNNGTVQINFVNNAGVGVNYLVINLTTPDENVGCSAADGGSTVIVSNLDDVNRTVQNGEKTGMLNFDGCTGVAEGDKFQGTFEITYGKSGESVTHTTTGTIQGRVE